MTPFTDAGRRREIAGRHARRDRRRAAVREHAAAGLTVAEIMARLDAAGMGVTREIVWQDLRALGITARRPEPAAPLRERIAPLVAAGLPAPDIALRLQLDGCDVGLRAVQKHVRRVRGAS